MEFGFQSDNFFMLKNATDSPYMITKVMIGHPNRASVKVGGLGLKRVLMHKHSKTNQWVADVEKQSFCIKCPSSVFKSVFTTDSTPEHVDKFYNCATGAFDGNGGLKATYKCSDADAKHFLPMGLTF